jgi:penicillin-binding protein 2
MSGLKRIKRLFSRKKRISINHEIAPDEIMLDASNLPDFDKHQFEGRLEKPISRKTLFFLTAFFLIIGLIFTYKVYALQLQEGEMFAARSENNRLRHTIVFSDRGVVYDRNKTLLAWNEENPNDPDFSLRKYATSSGFSNILGYIKYPSKDSSGFYYREDYIGMDGIEKYFNNKIKGTNGIKITETDVLGEVVSQSIMNPPKTGEDVMLSIDSRIQHKLYSSIEELANRVGFVGGSAAIMDIETGEMIAQVSYPEYSSQILSDGTDIEKIKSYFADKLNPMLDRPAAGLYVPGSIVKPFMALAALNEGVISPDKVMYTEGQISIPNPYNPGQATIFRDWKNHGSIDMRHALAVSSDVYFYAVGGGYKDQRGIGIANIEKYMKMFGFSEPVGGGEFFGNQKGVIPSPEWKKKVFNGENWTIGNTYHTSIGQYGFQMTPLQMVRGMAALANYGKLVEPTIIKVTDKSTVKVSRTISLPVSYYNVVHDGMRLGVKEGTARALDLYDVEVAAKTGTAELGVSKEYVNSWVTGFFPYKKPRYAFVLLMERGHRTNLVGASAAFRPVLEWMVVNTPEYFK